MLEDLRKNFMEEKFKMIIYGNKIDILNYKKIESIKDNEIIIKSDKDKIYIKGKDLVIIKLVKDEVLIQGLIDRIDFYG